MDSDRLTNIRRRTPNKEHFCCIPVPTSVYLLSKFVFFPLVCVGSLVAELVSDVLVALRHYSDAENSHKNYWRFAFTLSFIFAPSILFALYALYHVLTKPEKGILWKLCCGMTYVVAVFTLSLWPLYSYFKMLYYGIKAMADRSNRKEHEEKVNEIYQSHNFATQNLMIAFLQAVPQILLQLYIILSVPLETQNTLTITIQIVSVVISLFTVTSTVTRFHKECEHDRSLAALDPDYKENEVCCLLVQFLWFYLSISARVVALTLFAVVFQYWVFVLCAIHVAVMATCVMVNQTNKDCVKMIASVWIGFIYIFVFVEYKGNFNNIGKVISLHILYYVFTLPQNIGMVLGSYFALNTPEDYHLTLVIFHFISSSVSLVFMLCYLGILRPFLVMKRTQVLS